ncbi:MAG: LysR substrate-binding domain-containing protein [Pseudomonadota bacterium]
MKMKLNHRQLEAFHALMETGSVTEAADRIHVTQPAASRLIGDLEHAVGYGLFRREKKRLYPTPEALALFEEVDRSFLGLETIAEAAREIGTNRRGLLHIAGLPAMALGFLPKVISAFCGDKPDTSVTLQICSSQRVLQCVASQQFDIGFAEIDTEHPGVDSRLLYEAPMVAILPRGHELLSKDVLVPRDFEKHSFVSLGSNYGPRKRIDAVFLSNNVTRKMQIEAQLSMAVASLVANGAGVSIIDHITASDMEARGLVATRPFLPEINYQYRVLRPSHRPDSLLCSKFLEITKEQLATANKARKADPLAASDGLFY